MYSGSQEYRRQEVLSATPLHLVIMAYDLAIRACDQKDIATALNAVSALRDALDFEYGEIANNLLSLYQWCLDCIRKQEFESAKHTLVDLREAWITIEKQLNTRTAPALQPGTLAALRAV